MNPFDPTIESSRKIFDNDCNCTAIDTATRELCGETETMKIIDEFQKLYEARIENVDQEFESEFDKVSMKLEISKEWIKNLKEQNVMLVQVVEDLEQAACNRVKLLEERLKHSSVLVSGNVSKSMNTEKTIHTLSNRVSDLEKDEKCMQQKIEFLQSDIRGLLELIRRAVEENHWNLDDIKFFEIQPSDIPVPAANCTCNEEDISQRKVQALKSQIKHLQENEKKMIVHEKELEDKLIDLNAKLQTKEDTVKACVSQFQILSDNLRKRVKFTDQVACSSFITNDQETIDNQVLSYLNKVKSLMEQEKEHLSKLKIELEKTVENLCCEEDKMHETSDCNVDNIKHKLTKNIEYVNKIYLRKEESIEMINSLFQMENNHLFHVENFNSLPNTDINQWKLIDVFRACTVEAQLTMEDMKEEINIIVSSFKCRHQKYVELNKEVMNVQNQLIKSQGIIAEVINKLQLQEEERMRHNDRIISGKNRLKDIKNEINLMQFQSSIHINEMQTNENVSNYGENVSNYDLLCSAIEEIEQTSSNLQIFQVQLTEHDIVDTTLSQKEQKLQKLEEEVDVIHLKVQNVLETFFSPKEFVSDCNIMETQLYTQILNEILQTKQAVYKLRKEHDELKYKLSQSPLYPECDKKTCLWKCRVTDLQDQVKILQHEAKCNEEANNFLRNNIQSIEEELHITQAKADNYRRSHSVENMTLKRKIIELENTLKLQKEIECTLRRQLNDSEVELKKSKELLNSSHNEHNMEETLLRYGCYQFRHDTMTAPQLFKKLQNAIKSTKTGLQEFKAEFKRLICEDSSNSCSSAKSLMNLLEKLQKYENELDNCFQEIEELKNTLYSKDKLIENMDEIIKIQKDSIVIMQAELKELHQKIDNQDQIISQYEKEKKELLRQNEFQVQTIGHLQNAVVEAKKCIDQMGHKTVSDISEQWSTISPAVYSQRNVHDV
ncbi:hypothetical protein QLX08_009008 [Tetragonisca angustula]|uniref:Uncharacterized protein n=1 Tax=Tetragonisca angustula TaxID=166442 RepID=A0AAW0ZIA4_9HYME